MKKLLKIIFVVITVMGIKATNIYAMKKSLDFQQDTVHCDKNSTKHTKVPSEDLTRDTTPFQCVQPPCPFLPRSTNHVPAPKLDSDFQMDETFESLLTSDCSKEYTTKDSVIPKSSMNRSTSKSRNTSHTPLLDSHSPQKDSSEEESEDRSLSEEYSQYYEYDEKEDESVEISSQVLIQTLSPEDVVNTENFKEYFEMKIDNHLCDEIVCKRLLIRPTELFFEKRPVLKKDILQQILSANRTSILHKFKIENSKIINMLNVFDLIVIDSEIKTDKRPLVNPHRWIVKISKKLTQDVYINKKFLRKKIPIYPNAIDMIVSYSIWCD